MQAASASKKETRRIRSKVADRAMTTDSVETGRVLRISDPEMRPGLEALRTKLLNDPDAAKKWLQELGYLTPGGNISRRYGGR